MNKPNHLIEETSPYLKQHAYNPVDWYPWGEVALAKARAENKPILLSIGYSACHWCHVMAHESFEDEETARLMNEFFINVKVDREERPDLDKIYQTAHYLLTQQNGGWPLTIFLTPDDLAPFFSGTYFPLVPRYQMPAFKDILRGIHDIYENRFEDIKKQNAGLTRILNHPYLKASDIVLTDQPLKLAHTVLKSRFDPTYGGFTPAPKFPHPSILLFLLEDQSEMAKDTLKHMADGGIYDQLQGGFFRYSVDAKWEIPHFEKMLYDNAELIQVYAQAGKVFVHHSFSETARASAQFCLQVMQAKEGGFFSSISADSEGHEGKYYVWKKDEVEKLLTAEEYAILAPHYGFDQPPNFENHWHLYIVKPLEIISRDLKIPYDEAQKLLASAKNKLLAARQKRIAPDVDEKILTSWNALMINGILIAGDHLQDARLIDSAFTALQFIQKKLWRDNRLLATYKDGKAHLPAYLDDYAYLLLALITSLQIKWNTENLLFAIQLANILLDHFYDDTNGGFFFTANDHEKLIYRPKSMMDEASPSGNGVIVSTFLTLGHLLGETRYLDAAYKTLQSAWPNLTQFPSEHCSLLLGLKHFLSPPRVIVIRGKENEIKTWREKILSLQNRTVVFSISNEDKDLPGFLKDKQAKDKTCAYICKGMQCEAVTEDLDSILSF